MRKLFYNVSASTVTGRLDIDWSVSSTSSIGIGGWTISRYHTTVAQFVCHFKSFANQFVCLGAKFFTSICQFSQSITMHERIQHNHFLHYSSAIVASARNDHVANAKRNAWHSNANDTKSTQHSGINVQRLRKRSINSNHCFDSRNRCKCGYNWLYFNSTNYSNTERTGSAVINCSSSTIFTCTSSDYS